MVEAMKRQPREVTEQDEAQRDLKIRFMRQASERDEAADNAGLAKFQEVFPEGGRLVIRAAETAKNAHWYRGGLPFLMTHFDLIDMMVRSGGRCELSGVPFSGETFGTSHKRPFIPSIDRIRPKEAYMADNCRLVCWAVNLALGEWGDEVWHRIMRSAAVVHRF
jgi:hypothetical protein